MVLHLQHAMPFHSDYVFFPLMLEKALLMIMEPKISTMNASIKFWGLILIFVIHIIAGRKEVSKTQTVSSDVFFQKEQLLLHCKIERFDVLKIG